MELNGTLKPSLHTEVFSGTESTDEMWRVYIKTRSEESRNRLMLRYAGCVKPIAQNIHSRLPAEVELEDLISAGIFGLMDAIDAFEPERCVRFETYSMPRIRGAILDELRAMDWVPRLVRYRTAKMNSAKNRFAAEQGRDPTPKEIEEHFGLNPEELQRLLRDSVTVKTESVTKLTRFRGKGILNRFQRETFEPENLFEDHESTSPQSEAISNDLREFITRGFDRKTRLIIILHDLMGHSMKDTGRALGISESRVSQLHTIAIKKIRGNIVLQHHYRSHTKL